ncbi:MAG: stationary-phase survival protein SurE [Acidimicrobiales bacterium]|nr:stationary-phase survival protein SurE [Acidimicrobiales bacterium]
MRLLVTNDDGIEAEGIQALARHLAGAGHDLLVVAPDRDYSGSGASLGAVRPDVPLPVRRVRIDGLEDVEAWALSGPPALAVVAARLGGFGDPPDVVVSGINAGLNTGRSLLHSGTVGAALTAQSLGLRGLAVSVDLGPPWHWETAAAIAVDALERLVAGPGGSVLNLNVPSLPRDEVLGVRWARLAGVGAVRATVSPLGDDHLQFELAPSGHEPEPDTDQGTVQAGWASLTALVGVTEAWPDRNEPSTPEQVYVPRVAPGAEVHPVRHVPDDSDRPRFPAA